MASIKVAVRVRPINQREINLGGKCIVSMERNQTSINKLKAVGSSNNKDKHSFAFDYSYWSCCEKDSHFAPQEKIYEDLGSAVVLNAIEGYNSCVFAYGQTGSGKTHTMMGSLDNPGLIPRICQSLFSSMVEGREAGITYRVEVSYLEIYNERVKDLLYNGSGTTHSLKVREHPEKGIYVENLTVHLVTHYSDIQSLMRQGSSLRTTASTNMNDTSSRSHAIFTVTFIQAKLSSDTPSETRSKLHLVDLAGSERADASGATGKRLKEGAHINKSLVTLGSVISALAEQFERKTASKRVFIPYRDSVLTWLLKDSLGGNSKTIMIATISPAEVNYSETLSTLRYANRAKNIINKPTINEDPNVKLIRDLRNEISKLKSLLGENVGICDDKSDEDKGSIMKALTRKQAQEKELTDQWTERWRLTHMILQEQQTLGLRKAAESGHGVVLVSERPHLVLLEDDLLSTGVTLYHLNDGVTTIGTLPSQDITLQGGDILEEHCSIFSGEDGALLKPERDAQCWVNSQPADKETKLTQGCVVVVGCSHMFKYNNPQEAAQLRKEGNHNKSLLNLSRLSFLSRSHTDLVRSYDQLPGVNGETERKCVDDSGLATRKKYEAIDCCEISTQTSNHSQGYLKSSPTHKLEKSHINENQPRSDSSEEHSPDLSGSPSVNSSPASDTFYTATSALSPNRSELLSPLSSDGDCVGNTEKNDQSIQCENNLDILCIASSFVDQFNSASNDYVQEARNDLAALLTSPIKRIDTLCAVDSPYRVLGAATSTPKGKQNVQSLPPLPLDEAESADNLTPQWEFASSSDACIEKSELISLEQPEKVPQILDRLRSQGGTGNRSVDEQLNELKGLTNRYGTIMDQIMKDKTVPEIYGGETPSGTCENNIKRRPSNLDLHTNDLDKERFAMFFEMEVKRRVVEEVEAVHQMLQKKYQSCHSLLPGRMVRSSFSDGNPRLLSPSEIRPFSSMTDDCRYNNEAGGLLYQSISNDDLLLTPEPLLSPSSGEFVVAYEVMVTIPNYEMIGAGSSAHWEYEIHITAGTDSWTLFRRYRRFRELHWYMCHKYGKLVEELTFPPRVLFCNSSEKIVLDRKGKLETYLQQLIVICSEIHESPLCCQAPSKEAFVAFSQFFERGIFERSRHTTS